MNIINEHKPTCNILKNKTGSLYPHLPCNCGIEAKTKRIESVAPEMYEQLHEVLNWMEYLDSLGVSNDDLYSSIDCILKEVKG